MQQRQIAIQREGGQGHYISQLKEHSGQGVIADQRKILVEREGT